MNSENTSHSKHTPGGIWEMIAIAFPMVVANACDTVLIFTDRLFMSRLDPVLMNASMAGGLSVYMMMTFILGLTGYTTALSAQYLGAGEKTKCPVVTTQAMIIAAAAYPVILFCKPLAHTFFHGMGIAEAQLGPQIEYFDALLYIIIIGWIKTCLNGFFSGIGRTRMVMISSIVTMVLNVVFNYVLIFGKFGFPELGILGAAYGSILASFVGLVVLLWAYFQRGYEREFSVSRSFVFDWDVMKKLLRYGYPAGLEMFLNMLSFTAMVMIFHAHTQITATAATVMFNWDLVAYVPLIGIEIGVTSLVGRYMGAGRPEIAKKSTTSGIRFGLCYSAVIFVLFLGFPHQLVGIFHPVEDSTIFNQSIPIAVNMLRLASLYVLLEVIMIAYIGALRGAGDTLWAMILTVSLHWIVVPLLYVILNIFKLPPEMAWTALIVVFFIFLFLIAHRYHEGKWMKIHMVEPHLR